MTQLAGKPRVGFLLVCITLLAAPIQAHQGAGRRPLNPNARLSVLIVDLDQDGYALVPAVDGVLFDLDADGQKVRVGWTRAHARDGFLAMDLNGNGLIDNGQELLGNSFRTATGGPALNGFDALLDLYLQLGVQNTGSSIRRTVSTLDSASGLTTTTTAFPHRRSC